MVLGEGGFVREKLTTVPRDTELLPELSEILSEINFFFAWNGLENLFLVDLTVETFSSWILMEGGGGGGFFIAGRSLTHFEPKSPFHD